MHTTLLAVTGLSPAVVTETVWALAKRRPRIVPQRVGFITTSAGAAKLQEALFTKRPDWGRGTVWDALRSAVKAGRGELVADDPRVIAMPDESTGRMRALDDIETPEQNEAAAEFIFGEVWNVVRDKDRRLIASIAGGRKTMGALLHASVSLIGRETDLLTHVLVDPPFDTIPTFFFPGQPGGKVADRAGRAYATGRVKVRLAELPFVPLRNRFRELDALPGSFLDLRREMGNILQEDAERPVIEIVVDHKQGALAVAGHRYRVRPRALAVLEFVLRSNLDRNIPLGQAEAAEEFGKWYQAHRERLGAFDASSGFTEDDIKRELSHVRTMLRNAHAPWMPATRTLRQAPFRLEVV